MVNVRTQNKAIDNIIFFRGVIEDIKDPLFLGRCKVRVIGLHSDNLDDIPTEKLPWAMSLIQSTNKQECPYRPGDWVLVVYLDQRNPIDPEKVGEMQTPIILGMLPGIPSQTVEEPTAFADCTPDDREVPRPPDQLPIEASDSLENTEEESDNKPKGMFSDPDTLPGNTTAFGELKQDYDQKNYKYDVTKNCYYDKEDAEKIIGKNNKIFNGTPSSSGTETNIQRYPFESSGYVSSVNEPTISRLSRNEKIEQSIVAIKQGNLASGTMVGHISSAVGSDEGLSDDTWQEPKTPYNSLYPFNHVTESESGHTIEIDDSPGAERLHWYHRSGTFNEIHPEGQEVNNVKKSEFNIITEDLNKWAGGAINSHSVSATRIYSEDVINLTAGKDINRNAIKLNTLITEDSNFRAMNNNYSVTDNETRHHTKKGIYVACVEDVIHIWAEGNVCVHSEKNIQLDAKDSIIINSGKQIDINSPIINMGPMVVNANVLHAETASKAGIATPGIGESIRAVVNPPNILDNDADDDSWYEDLADVPETVTLKEGFMFPKFAGQELLYKPMADGAPKTARILCANAPTIALYEALPTGELEEATIKYKHKDGTITEWTVIRPVHKVGKLIETNSSAEMFEDSNRNLHRMLKPGTKYPKQMFLSVDGSSNIGSCVLVLNSTIRHESLGDFNESVPYKQDESLKQIKPKPGYLLPKFAGEQLLIKPIADGAPKTARILAISPTIAIFEATATNEIQKILTKYRNKDNSITEKIVSMPIYKIGKLLESNTTSELFEGIGPRFNHRMLKEGTEYGKQYFVSIDGTNKENSCVLIFDSSERNESLGDFNDKV